MKKIKLPKGVWSYDPKKPLGPPGGFGVVFAGLDEPGQAVAVKRLNVDAAQAAHRELRIARELASRSLQHVMPVLDAGQDSESDQYFVVMPVAERSLQDKLRDEGPLTEIAAAEILSQIVKGLAQVPDIVHRDLKPGNVLFLDGRWHVADFGIARFVEESTSAQTLKDCLSPHFAAPEQWRYEQATSATDVYALGCVAYTLLKGQPPFEGSPAELQDKHCRGAPPDATGCSAQMQTLVAMMLRKAPGARPSLARVGAVLNQILQSGAAPRSDPALDRLAVAAAAHERQQAEVAAEMEKARSVQAQRNALAIDARTTLLRVFGELARRITASVPSAVVRSTGSSHVISVGPAKLEMDLRMANGALNEDAFPRSEWDVICGAVIEVEQSSPHYKRAASLWYTRRGDKRGDYRWYEVGYEGNPLTGQGFEFQPAAVTPELADRAHSPAMDVVQASYPPVPIDDEDVGSFCERWAHILAEACAGKLQHMPTSLPVVR